MAIINEAINDAMMYIGMLPAEPNGPLLARPASFTAPVGTPLLSFSFFPDLLSVPVDFADFADLADVPLVDVVVVVVVDVVVVVVVDMVVVAVVAVVAVDAVVVVVVVVDFEFGPALRTIMASAIPSAGARDLLPSAKMLANSVSVG